MDALDSYSDIEEYGYYININTEEEFILWDDLVNSNENKELYNHILNNPNTYLKLPGANSVNMVDVMNHFIDETLFDEKQRKKMKRTMNHKSPVIEFLKTTSTLGITKEWENYRNTQYEVFAKKWCDENNIAWVEI